jgi:hypothetical protein
VLKYYPLPDGTPANQPLYTDILRQASDNHACSFLSLQDLIGTWDQSNANGWQADEYHFDTAGQAVAAGYLSRMLRTA